MKVLATLAVAVALIAAQDRPPREIPRPCDVTNIENRDWCPKDGIFVEADEIERGRHEPCGTAVQSVKTCVKTAYPCDRHGAEPAWHARRCCPINRTDCCRPTTVLSKVEHKCETCLKRGRTPADVVHTDTRHSGPIVTTCVKSGNYPHGGESTPAFGEQPAPTRRGE